jgi:hypothetical protein
MELQKKQELVKLRSCALLQILEIKHSPTALIPNFRRSDQRDSATIGQPGDRANPYNPAAAVHGPRYAIKKGKTAGSHAG